MNRYEKVDAAIDKKFTGQTDLSQAILGALEYRGINDAGKYLDEDINSAILPIIKSFIHTTLDKKIETLEQELLELKSGEYGSNFAEGYSQALSDAIAIIRTNI